MASLKLLIMLTTPKAATTPLPKGGGFTLIPHRQSTGQTLVPVQDLRECQAALPWLASHQFLPGAVLWYGHDVPKGQDNGVRIGSRSRS